MAGQGHEPIGAGGRSILREVDQPLPVRQLRAQIAGAAVAKFFGRNAFQHRPMLAQQCQRLVARARIDGDNLGLRQASVRRFQRLPANSRQRICQRLAAVKGQKDDGNAGRIGNLGFAEGRRVSGLGRRRPVQFEQAQEE